MSRFVKPGNTFHQRKNQKSNFQKKPYGKYNHEFNTELNRNMYFIPDARVTQFDLGKIPGQSPQFEQKQKTSLQQILTQPSNSYLYKFVVKLVEHHLWKYPKAKDKFIEYMFSIGHSLDTPGIYATLNKYYLALADEYKIQPQLSEARGQNRARSIDKYIVQATNRLDSSNQINKMPQINKYLDIGCFDGHISKAVGALFNLDRTQIYGVDIKSYQHTSDITFMQYDGKKLPFVDASFELVTCLMTLHHVDPANLEQLIAEITRVLKPGGIVILREHDVGLEQQPVTAAGLDLMHDFYDYVWDANINWSDMGNHATNNYKNHTDWTQLFHKHNMNNHVPANVFRNFQRNPFMAYMCSYVKLATELTPLYRILPDTAVLPRRKYERRPDIARTAIHWGQRKLLLTEIEFLTLATSMKKETPIYVIYAGAAPGTHIPYLSTLFPQIHFELYDPREFNLKLNFSKMINTHVQYFTDETANEWASETHPQKTIFFISDIRTGDTETMTSDDVEARVKIDHAWQKNWYNIIKPCMSMFKFRLPWDDNTTEYLDGQIYIQPYPPTASTETRLIVGAAAGQRIYNNREYEEQLFYFNNYVRETEFSNVLQTIEPQYKNGLTNKYDCAAEVHILEQYLTTMAQPTNQERPRRIAEMSHKIDLQLSTTRTLTSVQPLKQNKKNIMKQMQLQGIIPNNIEFNQNTYNTYVVPNYTKLN